MKTMKDSVFLGGTVGNSTWREELIPMLKIPYFNPVVKDWNEQAQVNELKARKECKFLLYVLTSEMIGVYSVAEVVDDSNKNPQRTILMVDYTGFSTHQVKSLKAVAAMVTRNGAVVVESLKEVAKVLNTSK